MGFGPARGGRMLLHLSSLLRNSEAYQITVKNAKGETMWDSGDLGAVRKTYITVTQTGYQATATLVQKGWNGRLPGADGSYNAGDWAPEGEYPSPSAAAASALTWTTIRATPSMSITRNRS